MQIKHWLIANVNEHIWRGLQAINHEAYGLEYGESVRSLWSGMVILYSGSNLDQSGFGE